jgi:hypothetical protein
MCVCTWQDNVDTKCVIGWIVVERYYLTDAGYMEQKGYMTSFQNTRYHQNDFRGVDLGKLGREEKFNYIHSGLCNIIQSRFGVVKERWHILEKVPCYKRKKQAMIIISCFATDNYLWLCKHGADPPWYPLSEWVDLNRDTNIGVVRDWISTVCGVHHDWRKVMWVCLVPLKSVKNVM